MSKNRTNEKLKLAAYTLTGTAGAIAVTGVIGPLIQLAIGTELNPPEHWGLASVVAGCIGVSGFLIWQAFKTLDNWKD